MNINCQPPLQFVYSRRIHIYPGYPIIHCGIDFSKWRSLSVKGLLAGGIVLGGIIPGGGGGGGIDMEPAEETQSSSSSFKHPFTKSRSLRKAENSLPKGPRKKKEIMYCQKSLTYVLLWRSQRNWVVLQISSTKWKLNGC